MMRWHGTRTQRQPARATPVEGTPSTRSGGRATSPRRRAWLTCGTVPNHHEHLRLAGHDVEVTEDEVGVVELHLENSHRS
jgi:hypothetical protein